MTGIRLHEPPTLDDAVELLDAARAVPVAGGTELFLEGVRDLDGANVISLRRIDSLQGVVDRPDGSVQIGSVTTHRAAELDPAVRGYEPTLARVFAGIGSIRVRNQGTVGGNVVSARPEYDLPPVLVALAATVRVVTRSGARELEAARWFCGQRSPELDGIVTSVDLPPRVRDRRLMYAKRRVMTRRGHQVVIVAVEGEVGSDGTCTHLRVVAGGLTASPVIVEASPVAVEPGEFQHWLASELEASVEREATQRSEYGKHVAALMTHELVGRLSPPRLREDPV